MTFFQSKHIVLLSICLILFACGNRKLISNQNDQEQALDDIHKLMTGEFSSAEQAQNDTLFYDINLVMVPIWEKDKTAKWLYVEQAVSRMLDKPYRQRVYKLTYEKNDIISSAVYKLPGQKRFVHAWNSPGLFDQITPDSLIIRQGCAVLLKKTTNGCYAGATDEKKCQSTMRGASYATSIVSVCKDEIISWDQGWNDKDEQVWGAEVGGYIFKRKE